MDIEAKIKELENNKEFMDKIAGMDNLADVAKALNEEGIEITEEELKKAGELYETQGGEIIEDQLENVSGGGLFNVLVSTGIKHIYKHWVLKRGWR